MDKPWKVVFAFIGVFIAGSVFGGFFVLGFGSRVLQMETPVARAKPQERPNQQPPSLLGGFQPVQAAQIMRRYVERLNLTAEQKEKINPFIQRATEDLRRQQQANFREKGFILQRLQGDIAKELTPDQRARLEKMEQKQKELRTQYGERFNSGSRPMRDGSRGGGAQGGSKQPPESDDGKGMRPAAPAPSPDERK